MIRKKNKGFAKMYSVSVAMAHSDARLLPEHHPDSFVHKFVRVNGVLLHYVDEGNPADPTVLFVHGFPDLWFGWRRQIKVIAKAGFRVLAPDMRGFGQSEAPIGTNHYGWKSIARDLVELLTSLGVDKAHFIGHDWGGAVVWRTCLHFPQRVASVAAVCTPYTPPKTTFVSIQEIVKVIPMFKYQLYFNSNEAQAELEGNTARFFRLMFRSSRKEDYVRGFMATDHSVLSAVPADFKRSELFSQEELDYYTDQYSKRGFAGSLCLYRNHRINFEDELGLSKIIPHKALMVTVGRDSILPESMTKGMERFIPDLSRRHIQEAGHWVQIEQTQMLNSILLDWLLQQSPRSTAVTSKI